MYLRQGYLSKLVDQEARLQLALDESTLAAREFAIVSIRIGRHGLGLDGARDLAGSPIAANGAVRRAQGESEADYAPTWWVCGEGATEGGENGHRDRRDRTGHRHEGQGL